MIFEPALYGADVARLLALEGDGNRLMPLVAGASCSDEASRFIQSAAKNELFPHAAAPKGALAGLWLYFSAFDEAHGVSQDDSSSEGSFWHAIVHRQEPDSGNSSYWFGRVGEHPVFPGLAEEAIRIVQKYPEAGFKPSRTWDPFGFILFCEYARRHPGTPSEAAALEIQRAEWQLLFHHCARPKK